MQPTLPTLQAGQNTTVDPESHWYAIRTNQVLRAEQVLAPYCDSVFLPKETVRTTGRKSRVRPAIPRVLFIRTTPDRALALERLGRDIATDITTPFWIYRYPADNRIQPIPQTSIDLLRLLTADDDTRCEIFTDRTFSPRDHVRVTGGIFNGYQGYVRRVRRNLHVIVEIEGICTVMLPYIHPALLEKID
ncbi:MAG: hypothetical protein J1F20_00950 [Muribaculaceae bacterium]|nr:hypothetical protein [Muribaculaceae bacterium]